MMSISTQIHKLATPQWLKPLYAMRLNDLGASVFNKGSTLGTNGTKDFAVQVHQANNLAALADGYKQYQIQSPDLQTNLSPLADTIQECKNAFSANPLNTTFSDMIKFISTVAAS